ncbi:phosphate acetyltransferase [Candidatus Poribacteria bacterium]|nr:phosphate acetyltransferase [Candidatus Poribacteria bacterium]
MNLIDKIKDKARKNPKRIVLAEGEEERTVKAAAISAEEGISKPVLLGSTEDIQFIAKSAGVDISGVEIINPESSNQLQKYAKFYIDSRKGKRVTEKMAERLVKKPLYFGASMVNAGDIDGMVAGCMSLTATVIKASELIIGLKEGVSASSSFFVMSVPDCPYGENGNFIFADAGVNPEPTVDELAEIAVLSARSAREILDWEPKVAMLSFSSKGSSGHKLVDKVTEATKKAREMAPELLIDGEFQFDTAVVPEVAKRKLKEDNDIAGKANILIFPDLNAGNIGYKMTQYLAKAEAYGPLFQGFSLPVNDLSRGASVDDIVGVMAFTTLQAYAYEDNN